MKLFRVKNGFIVSRDKDVFISYIEHSIRRLNVPEDVEKECIFETNNFDIQIKFGNDFLQYGHVGDNLMSFTYDYMNRELICSIGQRIYKVSVITRYQLWKDKYPGNHIAVTIEASDYDKVLKLDYIYYHGAKNLECILKIHILVPESMLMQFLTFTNTDRRLSVSF